MKAILALGLLALTLAACDRPVPQPLPGYPCYVEVPGNDGFDILIPVDCKGRVPVKVSALED